MREVLECVLRELGLTRNYKSYKRTETAILLGLEREERMEAVTKEIYPEAARMCGCSQMAVERSLRTSVGIIWRTNPSYLAEIAGRPLEMRPSAGKFIEIVAVYVRRHNEYLREKLLIRK